jgi:hypothetical protein
VIFYRIFTQAPKENVCNNAKIESVSFNTRS